MCNLSTFQDKPSLISAFNFPNQGLIFYYAISTYEFLFFSKFKPTLINSEDRYSRQKKSIIRLKACSSDSTYILHIE